MDSLMDTEVLQALIALGGVIYAATVSLLVALVKSTRNQKESELVVARDKTQEQSRRADLERLRYKFIHEVSHPLVHLTHWQPVVNSIEDLTKSTSIDRVLLLTAVNGYEKPTHTTAIWQYHLGTKDFVPYADEKIDDDYISRLILMKRSRFIKFKTKDAPSTSLIKQCYVAEKVVESVWVLLGVKTNPETGQVAYKYVSFSTHLESGIPYEDIRKILVVATDIKSTIYASGFSSMVA